MKHFNKTTLSLLLVVVFGYVSLNYGGGPGQNGAGPQTGAPFDGSYCGTSCHGGGPFTPLMTIQLKSGSTVVTQYTAGQTYNLVITISTSTGTSLNPSYGFQVVAVKSNDADAGTWGTLPSNTHSYSASPRTYVEHSSPLSSGVITIPWTAPTAGTGSVRFYAAGNVVQVDGNSGDDNPTTGNITITENVPCTAPTSLTATPTNITCNGAANGSIALTVNGGSAPFTYQWNGPSSYSSTTQNPTGLAAGTYTVVVRPTGCSSLSQTTTATITEPTVISPTASSNTPICAGTTLNLTGGGSGGTGTLTYSWQGPNSFSSTSQSPSISGATIAAAGTYTLTVKDASNCTKTATTVVAVNAGPTVTPTPTSPLCNAGTDGAVSIAVSGGGGTPYTYTWTGPSSFSSSNQNITGLAAGTYTVVAKGANNCNTTTTAVVSQPNVIVPSASSNTPVCAGGTLNLTGGGSGGTGTLTYSWQGPNTYSNATQSPSITGGALTINSAGTYTVTVKDANNCTKTATTNVVVDAAPSLSAVPASPLCNAGTDGKVTLTPTGGTTPLSYSWAGPASYSSTAQSPTNMAAGTYTVTVKTANLGCTTQTTAIVAQPAVIVPTAASNSPICSGSNVNLTGGGSGGTGTLTYSWTGPLSYTNATQSPSIANAIVARSGVYTVTVKDANNCTKTATTTVEVDTTPTLSTVITNITCNGANNGSVVLTATQGLPPYTYSWTGPSSFTASTKDISSLKPGTYTVNVSGSCAGATAATTTAVITEPTAVAATASSNSPVCTGDTIKLTSTGTGGTGTKTFAWAGPGSYTSATQNPNILSATAGMAGTYTVTVKDANNCTKTATAVVVVNARPIVNLGKDTAICAGDSLTLDAGNQGATYRWSNFAFTQTITVDTAATYFVAVTSSGCIGRDTIVVTVDSLPSVDSIVVVKTGTHTFTLSAGNAKFANAYNWQFGDSNTGTGNSTNHTYTSSGTFTVTLIVSSKCGADTVTRQVVTDSSTSVNSMHVKASEVIIYPNPAGDFVTVQGKNGVSIEHIAVYNVVGAKVYEDATNSQAYKINTASLSAGIYTVRIETSGGTVVKKLEIVR